MLDYLDKMIGKGYGKSFTIGAFSTPVGGGTVLAIAQPHFVYGIPAGLVVRPILVDSVLFGGISTLDADETEILVAVDSLGEWRGDGTSTVETASNMNSHYDKGSLGRGGSAFSANMTTSPRNGAAAAAPVLDMELARLAETADQAGTAANVAYRQRKLLYEPNYPVWLEGPCSLIVYVGGTVAVTALTVVQIVEAPIDVMAKFADL